MTRRWKLLVLAAILAFVAISACAAPNPSPPPTAPAPSSSPAPSPSQATAGPAPAGPAAAAEPTATAAPADAAAKYYTLAELMKRGTRAGAPWQVEIKRGSFAQLTAATIVVTTPRGKTECRGYVDTTDTTAIHDWMLERCLTIQAP